MLALCFRTTSHGSRKSGYGYGAGMPIAWQGWALLLSYIAAFTGLAAAGAADRHAAEALAPAIAGMVLVLTAAFVVVAKVRTRGGWRWRWGEDDYVPAARSGAWLTLPLLACGFAVRLCALFLLA